VPNEHKLHSVTYHLSLGLGSVLFPSELLPYIYISKYVYGVFSHSRTRNCASPDVAGGSHLLGYDIGSVGNRVLTYRANVGRYIRGPIGPRTYQLLDLEDKDTTLPRNVGIRLGTDEASNEKSCISLLN
jgi:hypothetical protein